MRRGELRGSPPEEPGAFRGRFIDGLRWMLGAQGLTFAAKLGVLMVLARLLTPADFGLIAMVTVITSFAELFKSAGLSVATIQQDRITHEQVNALFWHNVVIAVVIAITIAAAAPLVVRLYDQPRLLAVTWVLAGAFALSGSGVQHMALLKRHMRYRALAGIQVVALVMAGAVAVALAWLGAGYWALVGFAVTEQMLTVVGAWLLSDWLPGAPRPAPGVRSMIAFGGNYTGFNVLNHFSRNADNVLIGVVWGAASLGLYSKAYELLMLPLRQLRAPLDRVAIPGLSRLRGDPKRYSSYYFRTINGMAWIVAPVVGLLVACTEPVILIAFGPNWLGAVPIFQALGLTAFFQPLYSSVGWVFVSQGRADRMMRFGMVTAPVFVAAFTIGLPYGPLGVALAYAGAFFLLLPWVFSYAFKDTPLRMADLRRSMVWPGLASVAVFVAASLARAVVDGASPVVQVLAGAAAGAVLIPVLLSFPPSRRELARVWCALRERRPPEAVVTAT